MSAQFGSGPVTGDEAAQLEALRLPLGAWLRMLWNVAPPLLHLRGGEAGREPPFLSAGGVHLPSAPMAQGAAGASRWYSAAAAHAAAHIVFSRRVFVREGTAPITQALLGLLEDARVEALACRELPGLRRVWASLHTATPEDGDAFETLMLRLARGLIDPAYNDPHPWVRKGRARFYLDGGGEVLAQAQPAALRALASALGHDIGQMRMAFNARLYRPGPSYRDDNRWLWQGGACEEPGHAQPVPATVRPTGGRPDATPSAPVQWRYPEWDWLIGRARPDWCAVHERHPGPGSSATPGADTDDAALQQRVTVLLQKLALRSRAVGRREQQGDEIELDAAVRVALSPRSGGASDDRIYRRLLRVPEPTALVLLLDCSASSERPHGVMCQTTQLAGQQRVARLLARAASAVGWSLAIQAFDSEGRHCVNHWRVKDFGEPWSDAVSARLAGLRSGCSTRLGAALRHACRALIAQPAARRLVLVMGDGDPHDIDIHDPRYLVEDARHAVQTARLLGVGCLGVLLDDAGAAASHRIFGAGRSASLQHVEALPAVLERLLAAN